MHLSCIYEYSFVLSQSNDFTVDIVLHFSR